MYIINTRPAERAASLTLQLKQLGHQVIEYPLLALTALPLDDLLCEQFSQLKTASIIVVVSPIAAEIGMHYATVIGLNSAELKHIQWVAVGKATQKKLLEYGFKSICPEIETSEGMLKFDIFSQKNTTVAFWRGIGGRTFMMEHLRAQGMNLINMLLYTRSNPQVIASFDLKQRLDLESDCAVLISSEQSFRYWLELQLLFLKQQKLIYMVLGDRVTQVVKQYLSEQGLASKVVTLYDLQAQTIHQQLKQFQ